MFMPEKFKYPSDWPPEEYFVPRGAVSQQQIEQLEALINRRAGETEVDSFLHEAPAIFACALSLINTGHHGSWVVSQQVVRPPQPQLQTGLKPDYIVGGKNSDGFTWYVVELKGPDESIFAESKDRVYFSNTANKGIFQLLEYIDYCSEAQGYLRDTLHLKDFREPRGLLLIGTEAELESDTRRQRLRAAWHRISGDRLQIRTYSALLRSAQNIWESLQRS